MTDLVGDYYTRHHQAGNRYDFTVEGHKRGRWLAESVQRAATRLGCEKLDVLDIGCRDGTLTESYAKGHRVVGLDIDPEAVERARTQRGIDARRHDLNSAPFPFPEGAFDVVIAGEVLEHLQFPDAVVHQIRRVLRPGGVFAGSVPNAFRLKNRLLFLVGRPFELDPTHLHQFSPSTLRELLAEFDEVTIDFVGGRRRDLHPRLMATQMWFAARAR